MNPDIKTFRRKSGEIVTVHPSRRTTTKEKRLHVIFSVGSLLSIHLRSSKTLKIGQQKFEPVYSQSAQL